MFLPREKSNANPSCDGEIDEKDVICRSCGKKLAINQETKLCSFGLWTVNVYFYRLELSFCRKEQYQNCSNKPANICVCNFQ